MVRLSFSFLSVAALAVASASPLFGQHRFESVDPSNKCIPETSIKEYQLFELESFALRSLVSRELVSNLLVGGIKGNKNLQQLQFCIVSTDMECSPPFPTDCIRQNVEYRFRVNGPIRGYLHIDGPVVRIVDDFYQASGLNLYKEAGWGLRISHQNYDGSLSVFTTSKPGAPIRLEAPQMNNANQWFNLLQIYNINKNVESFGDNECIPETNIKEYQSFKLLSYALKSFVSKPINANVIVAGMHGNKMLNELEFCIVGSEGECNPPYPTNCIYQNVQYRFRVFGPVKGYLRIESDFIIVVPDFYDASPMNLYKEAGWGLRIEHMLPDGLRIVLATREPGAPLGLELPHMNNARQWFEIQSTGIINKIESFEPNQCVPETTVREYHPFLLKSSNLNTYVSKEREDDILVGGVANNKNFQQLELCIVSSDYGCSTEIRSNCIYQNVEYRFRVNGPIKGYLRIEGDEVKIVEDFEDASTLNLYKEAGWGLRIAHLRHDGSRIVFSAMKQGQPITLEEPVTNAARQWFQIIEANDELSLW